MKKLFPAIALSALFLGCASAERLNSLSKGMSREQALRVMGHPNAATVTDEVEYLDYILLEPGQSSFGGKKSLYFVRLSSGAVENWGNYEKFKSAALRKRGQ